jgi:hypothetical protein
VRRVDALFDIKRPINVLFEMEFSAPNNTSKRSAPGDDGSGSSHASQD